MKGRRSSNPSIGRRHSRLASRRPCRFPASPIPAANAANVETSLAEVLDAYESDHFRGNEANPGQHRAIRQPNLGGTKALLWDSLGNGGTGAHLRVYADTDSIWFTLNAALWAPHAAVRVGILETRAMRDVRPGGWAPCRWRV